MGVLRNRLEKVGLAQTGATEDEERVVVAAGLLGDRHGRGMGEAVALTDDEVLERVLRHQPPCLGMSSGRHRHRGGLRLRLVVDDRSVECLPVQGPQFDGGIVAKGDPGDLFDQLAVLVVHPAEVELAGGGDAQCAALPFFEHQALQPCPPRDRGDPTTQGLAKLLPCTGGGMCLHVLPHSLERFPGVLHSAIHNCGE